VNEQGVLGEGLLLSRDRVHNLMPERAPVHLIV
jgi:hypothetical protein